MFGGPSRDGFHLIPVSDVCHGGTVIQSPSTVAFVVGREALEIRSSCPAFAENMKHPVPGLGFYGNLMPEQN
jgi:hypothetical protein